MKQQFKVTGMSCAACSAAVEKAVRRVEGVREASVNLLEGRRVCELDSPDVTQKVIAAVSRAGFGAEVILPEKKKEEPPKKSQVPATTDVRIRLIVSIICTSLLMYVSMGHMLNLPLTHYFHDPAHAVTFLLLQLLLTLPVLYVNRLFFIRGIPALFRGAANMDSLVSMGSAAAVIYGVVLFFAAGEALGRGDLEAVHGYISNLYFESSAMILTLVTVGKLMEERAKGKTGKALERLVDLSPKTARVIREGREMEIDAASLAVDDIIVLRPGEAVPADGIIIEGQSSFDRSALTGESIPVDMTVGDTVTTATVNISGSVRFRATRVGEQTTLSRIIGLVREAGATKAPAARLADKISGIFVPTVMAIAAVATAVWLIISRDVGFSLSIGISILVVSCPCSLGLATPVAVTVAIGRSATDGVLIKSAEALEILHSADTFVFDKTGTLTEGKPAVTDLWAADGVETERLIYLAAAVEAPSEHPLSRAVTEYYQTTPATCVGFEAVFGKGVRGRVDGLEVQGGNRAFMEQLGVDITATATRADEMAEQGKTPLYFAADGALLGIMAVADTPRADSAAAVKALTDAGVRVVMLTGDNAKTAEAIRAKLGITEAISDVLPEDKEAVIRRIQSEGHRVVMIGDGINDSPALTSADVGISPASATDIAIDSADIILMNNSLTQVPATLKYSCRVMRNIKQNLFWAFFYNSMGIPVAAGVLYGAGILLSPMLASAAMSLSSLFVVTNALRLYKK